MDTVKPSQQNVFNYDYISTSGQKSSITFNSVFDSGNLKEVQRVTQDTYTVYTAPDCYGTAYEGSSKSWYYFGVRGVPKGVRLNFTIRRIHILYSVFKSAPDAYKPVYRVGEGPWKRVEEKALLVEDPVDKGIDVKFSFMFDHDENEEVFFAFTYPFSCEENQRMLDAYDAKFKNDKEIYYHHEIIVKSPQERPIDLITISSHEGKLPESESMLDDGLFPYRETEGRAKKFRSNKPVILITARVHPGETPASHTMNGIMKFLLDKNDVRAQLLRSYFVFMLVPILNPDGVYNGHYRMDIYNQNLNRYYKNPDIKKQPAIFAMKELVRYLKNEDRLFFYCDLHAHAAKKGCFLYGNALEYAMQVETIFFAKVLSQNCVNFEFDSCNFSQKQMHSRDRGEKLTKEGAGRVCVYKTCNLIHSYTMECGFHFSNQLNSINMPLMNKGCCESDVSDINSPMYQESPTYYNTDIYEDLGKSTLVSILDIFEKNPCTRIPNVTETLEGFRSEIAARIMKIPRFWKEANIKKKCLKINEVVREIFYDEFERKKVFNQLQTAKSSVLMKRSMTNMINIQASTSPARKSQTLIGPKKDVQRLVITAQSSNSNSDENISEQENAEAKPLPKLKTAVVPKEFRLIQGALILKNTEKSDREEMVINTEKRQMTLGLKYIEKSILVMPEPAMSQTSQSMKRGIAGIKEVRSQVMNQSTSDSKLFQKNVLMQRDLKLLGGNIEKKKATTLFKLPELERSHITEGQQTSSSFFMVTGDKNYLGAKPKTKLYTETSVKRVK